MNKIMFVGISIATMSYAAILGNLVNFDNENPFTINVTVVRKTAFCSDITGQVPAATLLETTDGELLSRPGRLSLDLGPTCALKEIRYKMPGIDERTVGTPTDAGTLFGTGDWWVYLQHDGGATVVKR